MSTGLKKFTKGCLLTALVTFIIGCLICLIGWIFGGFRQLNGMDVLKITGIPFRYFNNSITDFAFGFWDGVDETWLTEEGEVDWDFDDDWDDEYDWDFDDDWDDDVDWMKYEGWNKIEEGERIRLDLTADTLRSLDIDLAVCETYIMESDDDYVWMDVKKDASHFRYAVEDGDTLRIVHRTTADDMWNWRGRKPRAKLYLYLPKDMSLDNLTVEVGATFLQAMALQAHEIDIKVGAGECRIDGLSGDSVDLMVGAGSLMTESVSAAKTDMEVGAGEIIVKNARIKQEAELELGVGNLQLSGLIAGDLELDCGMGNVTLTLEDVMSDHDYEVNCDMGNVTIGDTTYTGFQNTKKISNGSGSMYDITCNLGNVIVTFDGQAK